MNVEQHAEAILRAAGMEYPFFDEDQIPPVMRQAILTAVEAAMVAGAEAMREVALKACDFEVFEGEQAWFSRDKIERLIEKADTAAIVKGMGK